MSAVVDPTAHVLARLSPSGRRLVTPELGSGERARWSADAYRDHVEPLERALSLRALDDALDGVLSTTAAFDAAAVDTALALALHRTLPLTRREAADWAVWRYLAVVHRPDVVRHRWELRSWTTMRARFWSSGTRPDSNLLGRLWWIAELSRRGDDHRATRRLLASPSLANAVFVRRLSSFAPFVHASAQILADQPASVTERVLARFNMLCSTMPVEGRGEAQIIDTLARLVDEVGATWAT